jgi:hypothetical protein
MLGGAPHRTPTRLPSQVGKRLLVRDDWAFLHRRLFGRLEEHALIAIVFAAAFFFGAAACLRFFRLGSVPPPLADEVLAAVDLRSGLEMGRHFTGERLGLLGHLTPILDGRYAVAAVFGGDVPDLRLATAAFGTATVGLVFLLARELGARRSFAVIATGALAVMPWHVLGSRIFLPAAESVLFAVLALVLVLASLRRRSLMLAAAAALAVGVSIYLYPVAIVTTPLFLATAVVFRRRELGRFGLARTTIVLAAGVVLMTPYVLGHLSGDRLTKQINAVITAKMVWNHGLGWGRVAQLIGEHWLSYLTPGFLFLHGDPNPRHSIQSMGELGWVLGTLGLVGIALGLIRRNPRDLLVLSWLVVYPVGDALTYSDATANSIRAPMGSVVWAFLAASGFEFIVDKTRGAIRVIVLGVAGVAVGIQIALFVGSYFGQYSTEYAYAFETGYSSIYEIVERRGVQEVPVTVHAGYERDEVLRYFSDYKLRVVEAHLACRELPYDVVHYTVLPRVFVIREDRDFAAVPSCIGHGLLDGDLNELRRKGVAVEVLARFRNAPTSPFETGILLVYDAIHQEKPMRKEAKAHRHDVERRGGHPTQ